MEDNSIETFSKFQLAVKIYIVELFYYLKFKQLFHLLFKLCDKSVPPAEPLLFLNMIDVNALHLRHQHQLLLAL